MGRKRITLGLSDLDRFLKGRERKFVTYSEGSDLYRFPYYLFVRLTKEAGVNITLRKNVIVDVDLIEEYLADHPETAE